MPESQTNRRAALKLAHDASEEAELLNSAFRTGKVSAALLRHSRVEIGKSLLDVQEELRLPAKKVDALERLRLREFRDFGDFNGALRSYVRYVGLYSDEFLALYYFECLASVDNPHFIFDNLPLVKLEFLNKIREIEGRPPQDLSEEKLRAAADAKEFGEIFSKARGELSRRAVARASGIDIKNLSQIENGETDPRLTTLKKMADGIDHEIHITLVPKDHS